MGGHIQCTIAVRCSWIRERRHSGTNRLVDQFSTNHSHSTLRKTYMYVRKLFSLINHAGIPPRAAAGERERPILSCAVCTHKFITIKDVASNRAPKLFIINAQVKHEQQSAIYTCSPVAIYQQRQGKGKQENVTGDETDRTNALFARTSSSHTTRTNRRSC